MRDGTPDRQGDRAHNILVAIVTILAILVWSYVAVLVARLL